MITKKYLLKKYNLTNELWRDETRGRLLQWLIAFNKIDNNDMDEVVREYDKDFGSIVIENN